MYQSQRIRPISQFGILLGLLGAGLVLGGVVTVFLVKIWLNVPMTEVSTAIVNPENVQFARILQALSSLFMFALPTLIFAMLMDKKPLAYLGFTRGFSGKQAFLIILLLFASLFVVGSLATLNEMIPISKKMADYFKEIENAYNQQVMAIAKMNSVGEYFISLIILALLPAVFEEMFFRGAMQQVLIGIARNAFIGILLTGIFFSAIHFSYYGFLPRVYLGFLLGYIFYYGKSIWLTMLVHFFNNAIVVTQMYFLSRSGKLSPEAMNENYPLYYGMLGIVVVIALFVVFRKESERYISENRNRYSI